MLSLRKLRGVPGKDIVGIFATNTMNQGWCYREQVHPADRGRTVLDYYTHRYRHSDAADWCERILLGQILVDGAVVTPDTLLQVGQHLAYQRSPWQEPDVPLAFEVLYEDEDIWVIHKPSGLPVLPGGGFLEHTLLYQLQQRCPQNTPTPIHRLGRGTSGLVLLARSPLAKSSLTQQMRDRQIHKIYYALVQGTNLPDCFTIDQPIGKIPHPVLGYIYGATPNGKFAQSDCQVLKRSQDRSLLAVTILTGRPHQIRIHLAAVGHPLMGEPLYGVGGVPQASVSQAQSPRQSSPSQEKLVVPGDIGYWLHAYHLAFQHPRTQLPFSIVCPPPMAFNL